MKNQVAGALSAPYINVLYSGNTGSVVHRCKAIFYTFSSACGVISWNMWHDMGIEWFVLLNNLNDSPIFSVSHAILTYVALIVNVTLRCIAYLCCAYHVRNDIHACALSSQHCRPPCSYGYASPNIVAKQPRAAGM